MPSCQAHRFSSRAGGGNRSDFRTGRTGRRPGETFAPGVVADRQARLALRLPRAASSSGAVACLPQALRDANVRPLLSKVSAKTLVLHRRGDRAVRVEARRYLAGRIAEARFVEVEAEDHWFWVGEQGVLVAGIGGWCGVGDWPTGDVKSALSVTVIWSRNSLLQPTLFGGVTMATYHRKISLSLVAARSVHWHH